MGIWILLSSSGVVGIGLFIWYITSERYYNTLKGIIVILLVTIIFSTLAASLYNAYILLISTNMKEIGKYHSKLKKRAYHAVLIDMINGDFEKAWSKLNRVKLKAQRNSLEAALHIQYKNMDEAQKATKLIYNSSERHYNYAVIAMLEQDWSTYEEMKLQIKNAGPRYALEADAAFRKGDLEQASASGDLAISHTRGLYRFILYTTLEHQSNNPDRESYFGLNYKPFAF